MRQRDILEPNGGERLSGTQALPFGGIEDELTVTVGGRRLSGWKSATITVSLEQFPSSFSLSISDPYPDNPRAIPMSPGARVALHIGRDLVLTGWVDRLNMAMQGPTMHEVVIQGRGLCQDLVDCSADLTHAQLVGGQLSGVSFHDLALKLAQPYAVPVTLVGSDPGPVIPSFGVSLGETPYEIIDRVAHYARFITYEGPDGALMLDKIGTKAMASGIVQGQNVERADVSLALDQRYSEILVVYNPLARFAELSSSSNQRAATTDPTMPRRRLRIIVSPQITPAFDYGKALAEWEMARRIGRSQAVMATIPGWRDDAGEIWKLNRMIPIDLPALKLPGKHMSWLIGTLTFTKSSQGTHTTLTVMPPDGFAPAPTPLQLFDWQVQQGLAQGLRPPGT